MSVRLSGRVVEPQTSMQLKAHRSAVGGADCVAFTVYIMSAPRVGPRALTSVRHDLSVRDLDIAATVDRFRLARSRHIEALHFHDAASPLAGARASRRALARLSEFDVLVRLGRRVGGVRAGSAGFVYAVGKIGHRLLHDDSTKRWREPSETFVAHTLAVADIAVDLTVADRTGAAEVVVLETEPACWRTFSATGGSQGWLKPDLHTVTAAGDIERSWFVEVDLGTESATAIGRKARAYNYYYATGIETDRHGVFPKVLFVADTERRAGILRRAIANTRRVNHDLFDVATNDDALAILTGAAT